MISPHIPQIIAHRGASGDYPEHCLEGYQEALNQGAEFIELDLVFSKDHHLIVRHDLFLSTTTNVKDLAAFADRARTHPLMEEMTGERGRVDWFAEDFTLAELKQLRARQPWENRSKTLDDQFEIPTFAEVVSFLNKYNRQNDENVGLFFDTKHAAYLRGKGFDFASAIAAVVDAANSIAPPLEYYAQSFEVDMLSKLNAVMDAHLIFLFERTENELKYDISKLIQILEENEDFIDSVGVEKNLLIDEVRQPTVLKKALQKRNVGVMPWTFRDDHLPKHWRTADEEYAAYFQLGVDAVFTDFPRAALRVREDWLAKTTNI